MRERRNKLTAVEFVAESEVTGVDLTTVVLVLGNYSADGVDRFMADNEQFFQMSPSLSARSPFEPYEDNGLTYIDATHLAPLLDPVVWRVRPIMTWHTPQRFFKWALTRRPRQLVGWTYAGMLVA